MGEEKGTVPILKIMIHQTVSPGHKKDWKEDWVPSLCLLAQQLAERMGRQGGLGQ